MKLRTIGLVLLALSGAQGLTLAGEVSFTAKPKVTKDGDGAKISFAVSAPTDVAVYVEDSKGRIVRHLAAGVLGTNAPAPLKPDSLEQSLVWDGTGDIGEPLPAGAYRVRVTAGTVVSHAGTAFSDKSGPNHIGGVLGLAAGPDGRVYVISARHGWVWRTSAVHVFRRGTYEKTIKPFPAQTPVDRVKPTGAFLNAEGQLNPLIRSLPGMSFYPYSEIPQQMAVTPAGQLVMAVTPVAGGSAHLAVLDGDGGMPYADYAGPALSSGSAYVFPFLASGSDGKSVFMTGLKTGLQAVHRVALPDRGPAAPFFGDPQKAGSGDSGMKDPRGIAVDGKGHVLVADSGNGRVVVLDEKDGRFLGAAAVADPSWVGVHPRTGALYVLSKGAVVKLASWQDPREVAKLTLPAAGDPKAGWLCALDASGETTTLWVARSQGQLMSSEDRGTSFSEPAVPAGLYPSPLRRNVTVDPTRRLVACRNENDATLDILDEASGATRRVPKLMIEGEMFRLGPDGSIYQLDHATQVDISELPGGILKRDRNGKIAHFEGTRRNRITNAPSGTTNWERDHTVDRRGDIYVKNRQKNYHGLMTVEVFGPDGNRKRRAIEITCDGSLGPKVDPQGNLYMAECIKPLGQPFPKELEGRIPQGSEGDYAWIYGSILKYGPKGGAVWFPGMKGEGWKAELAEEPKVAAGLTEEAVGTGLNPRRHRPRDDMAGSVQGALWWRYGFSYLGDMIRSDHCHCTSTDFDVDDFGRTFYPDLARFRVNMLDANGNEVLHFGSYGNQDNCGPDSYVMDPAGGFLRPRRTDDPKGLASPFATPELAFSWIIGVAASDRYVYVTDVVNRRVVRVRLGAAATESREFQWPGGKGDAVSALVEQARTEAVALAPGLAERFDWHDLDTALRRRVAPPGPDDARWELGMAMQGVTDLPAEEAGKLLGHYLTNSNAIVRLAATRGLDSPSARTVAPELLKKALADKDDFVAVTAGVSLFRLGDPSGVSRILSVLKSPDATANRLAQHAVMSDLTKWGGGTVADEIYPSSRLPLFRVGKEETEILATLLNLKDWGLHRAVIYCLAFSEDRGAIEPLREAMRAGEKARNLCRLIGVMKYKRVRESVPELITALGTLEHDERAGNESSRYAGKALAHIAAPESVEPLIGLLTAKEKEVRDTAADTLSRVFDATLGPDERLLPSDGKLQRVAKNALPAPEALRSAWEAFWKTGAAQYEWNEARPPLKRKE
jgi:hypothetical protein